jgi:hypothetical protein
MGGFKRVVLTRAQADQLVDRLSKHGIEIIPVDVEHKSPNEWAFCIKYGTKEIKTLKYHKRSTGEVFIIFHSVDADDFECIDMMIALLSQPVDDPDCGTQENQAGGQ